MVPVQVYCEHNHGFNNMQLSYFKMVVFLSEQIFNMQRIEHLHWIESFTTSELKMVMEICFITEKMFNHIQLKTDHFSGTEILYKIFTPVHDIT
jgi:hypothetical protein